MNEKRPAAGFTMIELLMTIVIVAILASLAVPSMIDLIRRNALQAAVEDLRSSFAYARGEAMNRSRLVTVCQSDDGATCAADASGDWTEGWVIFLDQANFGTIDPGEQILRVHGPVASQSVAGLLEGPAPGAAKDFVQFDRSGFMSSNGPSQGVFTLCQADGEDTKARGVVFNISGRSLLTRDSDGDGIHNWSAGQNLTCP